MFHDLLSILLISVVIVSILRRLQLPTILGYLLTGLLVSPYCLGLVEKADDLAAISHFGVVFLLFMIGLELSLPKLVSMRKNLLIVGGGQVIISTIVILLVSHFVGELSKAASVALAGALALSSTAVVTKQLVEQSELQTRHGQLSLSVLLFQDIAAVPFLIIIPALAQGGSFYSQIAQKVPIGLGVCGGMIIAGHFILRPLFHLVASARSSELFSLAALLVALSSAWLTESVGLSPELGAFLAGVMLAETEYVHQVESDIQPFRDILLGLFFVTVGVELNTTIFFDHWKVIAMIVLFLMLMKTLVIYLIARYVTCHDRATSLKSGLSLCQGGEFGFVILSLDASKEILSYQMLNIVIASIFVTLTIAPIIIKKLDKIVYFFFPKNIRVDSDVHLPLVNQASNNHVIICGYGRVGQSLALFLEQEDIPYIGIDLDPERLREATSAKEPVFYGDATREETLLSAGLSNAALVIITFDDAHRARRMLKIIRRYRADIPSLVRTRDDRFLSSLQQSGATEIIPEVLEASLMMASHMLLLLGQDPIKVRQKIAEIKGYRYQMLRSYYHGSGHQESSEDSSADQSFAHTIVITKDCFACGKTMEEIIDKLSIQIRSFTRGEVRSFATPQPKTVILEGDIFVVEGSKQDIVAAEELLVQGV